MNSKLKIKEESRLLINTLTAVGLQIAVLLSDAEENLLRIIGKLHRKNLKVCLKITMNKAKVQLNDHLAKQHVMIGTETLRRIQYIYLGQTISVHSAPRKEMRKRIGMGWSIFGNERLGNRQE